KDPVAELTKPQEQSKKGSVVERFNAQALEQEYADQDDAPDTNMSDEDRVETETTLNKKFQKEYDITPTKEDEDSLEDDILKDKITELLLDSHAI
ncbi:hypothetical protein, partial [Burkholderia cenocepacia]|uniref:hypothetical protein n=1 Tax=Burkholderia cenocepacia TaxID=95486 RepID=UPI0015C526AE